MPTNRSIFVVSDLHLGDGGARDNFTVGNREGQFRLFLDHVAGQQGELIINGDMFEFWQVSLGSALVKRQALLDRLAKMKATYVVGNHDADLAAFIGTGVICHPFFERMCRPFERTVNDCRMKFMHGHEVDPFNSGDVPGWGRILTILAGIFEDRNGSPLLSSGETVEEVLNEFGEALLGLWKLMLARVARRTDGAALPDPKNELTPAQNPSRIEGMLDKYKRDKEANGYDVAIVGHTHQPGRRGDWYFNSGSWATEKNSFLLIDASGKVEVFDWMDGRAVPNPAVL